MKENFTPNHIIISRTDAIGDVILTLPLAGFLKQQWPYLKISFLGNTYTKSIVEACSNIDAFINWDEIKSNSPASHFFKSGADTFLHVFPNKDVAMAAKKAAIKYRIGTSHRLFHLLSCNRLVNFSRKRSDLHEAQLNFQLLRGLGIDYLPTLEEIPALFGFSKINDLPQPWAQMLSKGKFKLILHSQSKGSAREWGLGNFARLIDLLPADRFQVFLTGTEEEGQMFRSILCKGQAHVTDLSGKLSLDELIAFIAQIDGLIAASTGPLHIAAALGKHALGIYPPIRPMHPGRWAPLGKHAKVFVAEKSCDACRKTKDCACMRSIEPESILVYLEGMGQE